MILISVGLLLGVSMAIWGSQTRGSWSQNIGIIGGLVWLSTIIYSFISFGVRAGFLSLIISFILGAVFQRIVPRSSHT